MDNRRMPDEIPMGFAMSLAQNKTALEKYARLEEAERQSYNERAAHAQSKSEMRGLVSEIAAKNDIG